MRRGKASRLNRTYGIQKEWITSSEVRLKRTSVPLGTTSEVGVLSPPIWLMCCAG